MTILLMVTDLPFGFVSTSRVTPRSVLLFLRQKYIGIFFIILFAFLLYQAVLIFDVLSMIIILWGSRV